MKDINFIKSYIKNFSKIIKFNKNTSLSITNLKKILLDTKKRNKKF